MGFAARGLSRSDLFGHCAVAGGPSHYAPVFECLHACTTGAESRLRDVGAVGGSDIRGAAERGPDGSVHRLVTRTIFGVLIRIDETLRLSHNSMGERAGGDGAFCD